MDRAHDLKAALSFHDHPLARQALERIAELEDLLSRALPYLPMGPIKKDKIGDEVARALTK